MNTTELQTPILIVGAGTGGFAAALSIARRGGTCILTEPTDWIGGQLTSQGVPSAASGSEHEPVAGSQMPGTWHWSAAEQTTGSAPVQTPARQESDRVHRSPSSHGIPSASGGSVQMPVLVTHTPGAWHWSIAVHSTGSVPVQAPAKQASDCVQRLPSSQAVPSAAGGSEQTPVAGLQAPAAWH